MNSYYLMQFIVEFSLFMFPDRILQFCYLLLLLLLLFLYMCRNILLLIFLLYGYIHILSIYEIIFTFNICFLFNISYLENTGNSAITRTIIALFCTSNGNTISYHRLYLCCHVHIDIAIENCIAISIGDCIFINIHNIVRSRNQVCPELIITTRT